MSGDSIVVSGDHLLNSSLDGSVPDDSVFNVVLNDWGSSGVGMVGLAYHGRGACHWGSNKAGGSIADLGDVAGSTVGTGHKGKGNLKVRK